MNCETLQDYLDRYGPLVAERARQAFEPLHVPTTDAVITLDLKRPMLPAQGHVVTAAVKTLKRQKAVYLCCECGCLGGENEIYDPVAKAMLRVDEITEPFHVWSYDEATGRRVIGRALVPFVKGIRNLYRVRLSNGREFVSTDHHRLLAENAWLSVRVCGRLPLEFDDRPSSVHFGHLPFNVTRKCSAFEANTSMFSGRLSALSPFRWWATSSGRSGRPSFCAATRRCSRTYPCLSASGWSGIHSIT